MFLLKNWLINMAKRGRPKNPTPKEHDIRIQLTAKEFRKLEEQCAVFGKTRQEVFREALDEYYLNHYWV